VKRKCAAKGRRLEPVLLPCLHRKTHGPSDHPDLTTHITSCKHPTPLHSPLSARANKKRAVYVTTHMLQLHRTSAWTKIKSPGVGIWERGCGEHASTRIITLLEGKIRSAFGSCTTRLDLVGTQSQAAGGISDRHSKTCTVRRTKTIVRRERKSFARERERGYRKGRGL
jgi:hypothetical protein